MKLGHREIFDIVRGFAVCIVLAYHSGLFVYVPGTPFLGALRGGFLGVDVFFVLSGFLITVLLLEEWNAFGNIDLVRFYKRRILRLVPALMVMLILLGCAYSLFSPDLTIQVWKAVGVAALYLMDYWVYLPRNEFMWQFGHTWSLAVEEQFYLVWPLVIFLMMKTQVRFWGQVGVLVSAILVSAGLRYWLWLHPPTGVSGGWIDRAYFGFDCRADALLIGCLCGLFFVRNTVPRDFGKPATIAAIIFLGYMILTATFYDPFLYAGGFTLVALSVGIILVYAINIVHAGAWFRWLRWIGIRSYALYLWHWPIFIAVAALKLPTGLKIVISVSAAMLLCQLSYWAVEKPFLALKLRLHRDTK